jgi:hypothetical protein
VRFPCVHAVATTPAQRLGVSVHSVTQPYQPSPKTLSGRPARRPFRGLLGVHLRYGLHTRAVTVYRDTLSEGFSHFVTSMTAPVASGWSGCRVGFAPTGKRRLSTAHATTGLMHCKNESQRTHLLELNPAAHTTRNQSVVTSVYRSGLVPPTGGISDNQHRTVGEYVSRRRAPRRHLANTPRKLQRPCMGSHPARRIRASRHTPQGEERGLRIARPCDNLHGTS